MSLEFNKDTHQYFINNKELISVSKILDNYFGNSYFCKKCNINSSNCKCKNHCNLCDAIRNAIFRGKIVHKCLELYFKNINKNNIKEKLKESINKKN